MNRHPRLALPLGLVLFLETCNEDFLQLLICELCEARGQTQDQK